MIFNSTKETVLGSTKVFYNA